MTYTKEELLNIGQLATIAGNFLLNEPDEQLGTALCESGYNKDESSIKQKFYDRLGISQSGMYLPPYEHVFRQCDLDKEIVHFPPSKHDGGADVESLYLLNGFHFKDIPVNALFRGANIPGDHLGYMLMFVGTAIKGIAVEKSMPKEFIQTISDFINKHLDLWVDKFCELLPVNAQDHGYLKAISDTILEAIEKLREWSHKAVSASVIQYWKQ